MSVRTGTKTRIAVLFLLLAATALASLAGPAPFKNATGCSFVDGTFPTPGGCVTGSGGCYECIHSDQYGYKKCYEWPAGEIAGCSPWSPENNDGNWGWR